MKKFFLVVFFICFGITTEVFFTAVYDTIQAMPNHNWKLEGHTYIWMAPIYAIIPLTFPWMYEKMKNIHIFFRSIVYMIGIFIVEFIAGFLLEQIIGVCPWDYTGTSPYEIMGYIRLDYTPAWMIFGVIVEKFLLYINEKIRD